MYPARRTLLDYLWHNDQDSGADAMLPALTPAPLRSAFADARLRVWLRGGMLRVMPFSIQIR
jgi:hypothetical protein